MLFREESNAADAEGERAEAGRSALAPRGVRDEYARLRAVPGRDASCRLNLLSLRLRVLAPLGERALRGELEERALRR